MITPKQASDTLQVSTSTVRRWSSDFSPFLSLRKGVRRLYTTDDIATLSRIKDLYKQGMNTLQVTEALPLVQSSDTDKALINITDFANALSLARADNAKLNNAVNELNDRLTALENYLSLPFYKRLGKRPPLS